MHPFKTILEKQLAQSIAAKKAAVEKSGDALVLAAEKLAVCLAAGRKILIFGNGGSASDAQHLAAEFVNRFQKDRPALAAIALTCDLSVITSVGNDVGFDQVFSRQISALARKDDVAWGISTSGNSENVIQGMVEAKKKGAFTIGLTGTGGRLAQVADLAICVDHKDTPRVQEAHIFLGHMLCEFTETILFNGLT